MDRLRFSPFRLSLAAATLLVALSACVPRCPIPSCHVKQRHVHRFVVAEETAELDSGDSLFLPVEPAEEPPPPDPGKKKDYRVVSVSKKYGDLPEEEEPFREKDEFLAEQEASPGVSLRRPSVPLEGERVPKLVRGRPWWKKQNPQVGELYRKQKRGPEEEQGFFSFLKKKKD